MVLLGRSVLLCLVLRLCLSQKTRWMCPLPLYLLKEFVHGWCCDVLTILMGSLRKPCESGVSLGRKFMMTNSICLVNIGLFPFSPSAWVPFGKLCFSRHLPVSFSHQGDEHKLHKTGLLLTLWISIMSEVIPSLSFLILMMWVLLWFFNLSR